MKRFPIAVRVGDQVYLREGGEEIGSVRVVEHDSLFVFIENAKDFSIAAEWVKAVHDGKVILDESKLGPEVRAAIKAAHTREEKGA